MMSAAGTYTGHRSSVYVCEAFGASHVIGGALIFCKMSPSHEATFLHSAPCEGSFVVYQLISSLRSAFHAASGVVEGLDGHERHDAQAGKRDGGGSILFQDHSAATRFRPVGAPLRKWEHDPP